MRYYIIFYTAKRLDGTSFISSCATTVKDGGLNERIWNANTRKQLELIELVITGFNEINESDFNDWIK